MYRRQVILQQLNPQLKPLFKDEDFVDAPPYLFGGSHQQVPEPSEATTGMHSIDNSLVDHPILVPSYSSNAGGLPTSPPQQPRSGDPPNRETVHNGSGSPTADRMAHLQSTFSSKRLSTEASELLLSSWRSKTNQSHNSLCSKWIAWCQPRNRNPFEGPVSDVANFLAELFSQGYQYHSLNLYHSAISSVQQYLQSTLSWKAIQWESIP